MYKRKGTKGRKPPMNVPLCQKSHSSGMEIVKLHRYRKPLLKGYQCCIDEYLKIEEKDRKLADKIRLYGGEVKR